MTDTCRVCGQFSGLCSHIYAPDDIRSTAMWGRLQVSDLGERLSAGRKDLICPVCGHTDRKPQKAGNPCPKCEALPGMGCLEHIDPDILSALEPFSDASPSTLENIWMYNAQPVALPRTSNFSVKLKFGEAKEFAPHTAIRVTLLGYAHAETETE